MRDLMAQTTETIELVARGVEVWTIDTFQPQPTETCNKCRGSRVLTIKETDDQIPCQDCDNGKLKVGYKLWRVIGPCKISEIVARVNYCGRDTFREITYWLDIPGRNHSQTRKPNHIFRSDAEIVADYKRAHE